MSPLPPVVWTLLAIMLGLVAVLAVVSAALQVKIWWLRMTNRRLHALIAAIAAGNHYARDMKAWIKRNRPEVSTGGFEGWVYVFLNQLEERGRLVSTREEGGPERGNRPRYHYRINRSWGEE